MRNYINIKRAFTYLPRTIDEWEITDPEIIQYMLDAIMLIGVPMAYQRMGCLIDINNHRASVPQGMKLIDVVGITEKPLKTSDTEQIVRTYSTNREVTNERETVTNTEVITRSPSPTPDQTQVDRIQYQGVINNYRLWESSTTYKNAFQLASYTHSTTAGHTKDCPNLYSDCKITYGIDPKYFTTNVRTGTMYVGYYSLAKDECGDFLVPDVPELLEAIAIYATMKLAEGKLWQGEANARYLVEKYEREWGFALLNARGKMQILQANLEKLSAIINEDLVIMQNINAFDNQKYYG